MLSSHSDQSLSSICFSSLCTFVVSAFTFLPSPFMLSCRVSTPFPQSPHQYHFKAFIHPLFSYSYVLFCPAQFVKPFAFNSFRTLCAKRPGWGMSLRLKSAGLTQTAVPGNGQDLRASVYLSAVQSVARASVPRRCLMAGTLSQDLRSGVRMLKKSPGFTFVAVLSLALGIGANTAIFTIINAVFLHPPPVQEPAQLAEMFTRDTRTVNANANFQLTATSLPNYEDYRDQNTVFTGLAATTFPIPVNWGGQAEPQQLLASMVSPNFFDVL